VKLETQPGRSHVTGYISREDDASFLPLTDLALPTSVFPMLESEFEATICVQGNRIFNELNKQASIW
jgi:hypothetical protein